MRERMGKRVTLPIRAVARNSPLSFLNNFKRKHYRVEAGKRLTFPGYLSYNHGGTLIK